MNEKIRDLLQLKADYQGRLNLIPYDGSPEIKEAHGNKYIYIRKRIGSRLTSTYVDIYSDELYQQLLKYCKEARELKKKLRHIEKELATLGYINETIPNAVLLNIDYARASIKEMIYNQAILEGVSTTFPQTETIIENGTLYGMKVSDVQKILNLKHAWEFILDKDLAVYPSNLDLLSHIAQLVNEGFYEFGGRIRSVPVSIGGTHYVPPFPFESEIKDKIKQLIESKEDEYLVSIKLCLYCMKAQIFIDGNKRAAVIFANHYLISKGKGLLMIKDELVPEFKKLLIEYYEDKNTKVIDFLMNNCIKKI